MPRVGNRLYYFDRLVSTQDWIKEAFLNGWLSSGDVCVARRQDAGRGRFSRSWDSKEGGIYLSFLIDWKEEMAHQIGFYLAVAIIDFLKEIEIDAQIKWPNDIFCAGAKLGGILIESIQPGIYACGIGLNLFNDLSSLERSAIRIGDLTDMLSNTYEGVFLLLDWIDRTLARGFLEVFSMYRKRLWGVPGHWRCRIGDEVRELKVIEVLETGRIKSDIGDFNYLEVEEIDGTPIR